jgi:hypothetical protein
MTGGLAGRETPGGREVLGPDGGVLLALRPNDWETRFFGRRIGALEVDGAALAALPARARDGAVSQVVAAADRTGYRLVQARLEVAALEAAAALEGAGFRLVDAHMEFLTRLDRRRQPRFEPPFGTTGLARDGDREDLLRLTHECFTANPGLHSRYKDPAYFTPEETARWFAAWLENGLADPGTLTAVWRVEGEPAAFFGFARRGAREGLPLYQSTIMGAAPGARGHKSQVFLQTTLFDALPVDEFWMLSVTQADNAPVFCNTLRLGRRFHRITLTFFRRGPVAADD